MIVVVYKGYNATKDIKSPIVSLEKLLYKTAPKHTLA